MQKTATAWGTCREVVDLFYICSQPAPEEFVASIPPMAHPGASCRNLGTFAFLRLHGRQKRAKFSQNVGMMLIEVLLNPRVREQTLNIAARYGEREHVCSVRFLHSFKFANQ